MMGESIVSAMKPLSWLALSLLAAASFPSIAQSSPAEREWCGLVSRYAESVMMARQSNVDVSELIKVATDAAGNVEPWKEKLITWAYESPRYGSAEFQGNATRDFKNDAYVMCMKASK